MDLSKFATNQDWFPGYQGQEVELRNEGKTATAKHFPFNRKFKPVSGSRSGSRQGSPMQIDEDGAPSSSSSSSSEESDSDESDFTREMEDAIRLSWQQQR